MPSSSIGNNKTWLDQADRSHSRGQSRQTAALEGMHDIYYGTALPPHRKPIPLTAPGDRIGETYVSLRPGQGHRRGRDQCSGPQHDVRRA